MKTMAEVARAAGVSSATASYVLNGRHLDRMRPSTIERVLSVAYQLGYRRNELARSLVSQKTSVIAFLVSEISYEPWARQMAGVIEQADKYNYFVKCLQTRTSEEDQAAIRRCLEFRVDGIIATGFHDRRVADLHKETAHYSVPLAVLDSAYPFPWGIQVISNDEQGCEFAIEHLMELGHARIALIAGDPQTAIALNREQAFVVAAARKGLKVPEDYLIRGNWRKADVTKAVEALLMHPQRPTALICASDETAFMAVATLRSRGFSVPRDMSVIGYSNLKATEYCDPLLTTVAPSFEAMGQTVVEHLLERIQKQSGSEPVFDDSIDVHQVPTMLVVRESTAPAMNLPSLSI